MQPNSGLRQRFLRVHVRRSSPKRRRFCAFRAADGQEPRKQAAGAAIRNKQTWDRPRWHYGLRAVFQASKNQRRILSYTPNLELSAAFGGPDGQGSALREVATSWRTPSRSTVELLKMDAAASVLMRRMFFFGKRSRLDEIIYTYLNKTYVGL